MVTKKSIFVFASCLIVLVIAWFLASSKKKKIPCDVKSEIFEITKKNDIFPLSTKVQIDHNYFFCHDVNPGDVIAISTFQSQKNGEEPSRGFEFRKILIYPKDHIELVKKANLYQVKVNGTLVKDLGGGDTFRVQQISNIKFFERKYKGVVPDDTYFIFSKSLPSKFQNFSKVQLKGRVIPK